jgi:hypothetical protein
MGSHIKPMPKRGLPYPIYRYNVDSAPCWVSVYDRKLKREVKYALPACVRLIATYVRNAHVRKIREDLSGLLGL